MHTEGHDMGKDTVGDAKPASQGPKYDAEHPGYEVEDVNVRGIAVFLTSHILPVVEEIATQLIMIRKGQIVWDSPASELPRALEEHYFEMVESPVVEELEWLGQPRS